MSNNEIKILSNMAMLLSKIDIKESYTEEEYSSIYQLIDGYKMLEKHFGNSASINGILNKKINGYTLQDLIRVVRNRASHIDKNNAVKQLILLQTEVDKNDINDLITKIKKEIDNIYERELNGDSYKLIMNTRMMTNLFGAINYSLYDKEPKNEFDKYCRDEIKKIMNDFDFANSSFNDFEKLHHRLLEFYQKKRVKQGVIDLYGEKVYDGFIRMMTDDTYTIEEAQELMSKFKKISK